MLDTRHVIALSRLRGIGRATAWRVLEFAARASHDAPDLLSLLLGAKRWIRKLRVPDRAQLQVAFNKAGRIIRHAERLGLFIIPAGHEDYPSRLLSIPDPPIVLYGRGDPAALDAPLAVAVVGTREPTRWGGCVSKRFGERFAGAGCVVVSGLALGCETRMASRTAFESWDLNARAIGTHRCLPN